MCMISVFFAYVTHHPCLWYAYSLHILLIILVYDIHILRTCSLLCVFACITHHPSYDMHILRICYTSSLRMMRVFFVYVTHILAYVTHVLHACYLLMLRLLSYISDTDGGYSPIPSNFSTKCSYDALLKC